MATVADTNHPLVPFKHFWFGQELQFLERGLTRTGDSLQITDRVAMIVGEAGTLKSRLAYSFLANGFHHEKADRKCGAVLFTSEGVGESELRSAIAEWGAQVLPEAAGQKRVLVRPVLPRFLSSSNFAFRLKLCIREMKKRLDIAKSSADDAWRVRVVIDNWNSMVDAHASLQRDDQLLQSLLAILRSEGVLAMIVATQSGSPTANTEPNRKHDVTRMEATRIHCWPVNFFGDRRIAICTSIPGKDGMRTSIAEIGRYNGSDYKLEIKNDFDFYEDLESGKAKRVKLKVKLYSGVDDSQDSLIRKSSSYGGEVSALFGDLFSRTEARDDVVSFEGINSYDSFKEYIQNLDRGQLDETLVFQVDEFWSGKAEIRPFAELRKSFAQDHDVQIDNDAFSESNQNTNLEGRVLRVPLHKDFGLLLADRAAWFKARDLRIDENCLVLDGSYIIVANGSDPDFSSMLAPAETPAIEKIKEYSTDKGKDRLREMVTEAKTQDLAMKTSEPGKPRTESPVKWLTVGDVWNALCMGDDISFESSKKLKGLSLLAPSWELFLRASQIVALQSGKRPFDVDLRTSESLSSLILEIWISTIANKLLFSEIKSMEAIHHAIFGAHSERSKLNLKQLVAKFGKEFEYALRTAIRFLPGRYRESKSPLSPPDRDAVAVRTWFATAVHCQHGNSDLTPLRLPGRFCTRGDWYLAVAKGSRSMSLAESAMAKLMSESMNRKRLREGIGLPVVNSNKMANVESALFVPEPDLSSYRPLTLREISTAEPLPPNHTMNGFSSRLVRLFRSEIPDYDASSEEFFLTIGSALRKLTPVTDFEMLPRSSPIDAVQPVIHVVAPKIRQIIEDFAGTQIAWDSD